MDSINLNIKSSTYSFENEKQVNLIKSNTLPNDLKISETENIFDPLTNSSDIINLTPNHLVHYPPFPESPSILKNQKTLRDTIISRNNLYGGNLNAFNNFMEERLIRYRPGVSQYNIEDTISNRHHYQLEIFTAKKSKKLTNSIKPKPKEEETDEIIEDFEQFSTQKIREEFENVKNNNNSNNNDDNNNNGTSALVIRDIPGSIEEPVINTALPIVEKDVQTIFNNSNNNNEPDQESEENVRCDTFLNFFSC